MLRLSVEDRGFAAVDRRKVTFSIRAFVSAASSIDQRFQRFTNRGAYQFVYRCGND